MTPGGNRGTIGHRRLVLCRGSRVCGFAEPSPEPPVAGRGGSSLTCTARPSPARASAGTPTRRGAPPGLPRAFVSQVGLILPAVYRRPSPSARVAPRLPLGGPAVEVGGRVGHPSGRAAVEPRAGPPDPHVGQVPGAQPQAPGGVASVHRLVGRRPASRDRLMSCHHNTLRQAYARSECIQHFASASGGEPPPRARSPRRRSIDWVVTGRRKWRDPEPRLAGRGRVISGLGSLDQVFQSG